MFDIRPVHWLLLATTVTTLLAQGPSPTVSEIESRITEVERTVEPPLKDDVLRLLREAKSNAIERDKESEQAKHLAATRDNAATTLDQVRSQLADLDKTTEEHLPSDIAGLETQRGIAQAQRDQRKQDEEQAHQALQLRAQRRTDLPGLLAAARAKRQQYSAAKIPADAKPALKQAMSWADSTKTQAMDQQIEALAQEERNLASGKLEELAQAELTLATKRLTLAEQRLSDVSSRLEAERKRAAEQAEAEAKARAAAEREGNPVVALLAKWDAEVVAEKNKLEGLRQAARKRVEQLKATRESLASEVKDLKDRMKLVGGLSDSLGRVFRQKRSVIDGLLRELHTGDVSDELGELQLKWFDLEQRYQILGRDVSPAAKLDALGAFDASEWPGGRVPSKQDRSIEHVQAQVTVLLAQLEKDVGDTKTVASKVVELLAQEIAESATVRARARAGKKFIDENVLWLRSASPVWRSDSGSAIAAWTWLLSPRSWVGLLEALWRELRADPVPAVILGLLGLALLIAGGRARRGLDRLGARASDGATATLRVTSWAVVLTMIAALPLPMTLIAVGNRLSLSATPESFARACASGVYAVGWWLLAGLFILHVTRPNGLAEAHFRWPAAVTRLLRRHLAWAVPLAAPWLWALTTLRASGSEPWAQSGGRLALIPLLAVLAMLLWRLLHPRTGVLAHVNVARAGVFAHWKRAWVWLGVGVPAVLAVLACLGFEFTAVELTLRLLLTIGFVLALLIVYAFVLRGLALARRNLARARSVPQTAEAEPPPPPVPQLELTAIGQQTRSLLHGLFGVVLLLGTWFLWVDVIPALGILRDVVLWSDTVDGKTTSVTLAGFLLAAVYVAITLLAARNIPGVLELTVLRGLGAHPGGRHAIKTIARYVILGIGFTVAFGVIGIGWSKVQWLIAALGVGLGFGLQEIFANFVSGIIILIEQPIRVGDLVTVAETDGFVTQIRMRATVVTDYDRRELIIPNKEFITGRVVNWSLTDPVTRIIFRVGVAYGTDANEVREALLHVASACPLVLDKPHPKAIFLGFGASSLDFQLRVFIASMEDWPALQNDINTRIQQVFGDRDLEIAFPQLDLHVRSAPGLVAFAEQVSPPPPLASA